MSRVTNAPPPPLASLAIVSNFNTELFRLACAVIGSSRQIPGLLTLQLVQQTKDPVIASSSASQPSRFMPSAGLRILANARLGAFTIVIGPCL